MKNDMCMATLHLHKRMTLVGAWAAIPLGVVGDDIGRCMGCHTSGVCGDESRDKKTVPILVIFSTYKSP